MSAITLLRRSALVLAVVLTGCAQMKSHDSLHTELQQSRQTGGLPAAIKQLESTAKTPEDRAALLYNLERGELLRQNRQYAESTESWLAADQKVAEWEASAKTDPSKLMGFAGAALISERLKAFEGQDYEKVWLTTRLALNRIAVGDWDNARVDIKRTHEREAVIAEFRAKETVAAEEEAKQKGVGTSGKELNGYPVETLNDPEVLKLKNGYQNALSHYLAGFLYEALNEPGLAAPGYRKAIELKPETPVLEDGLKGLDGRTSFTHKLRKRMTDVLLVIENGDAPARKPKALNLPVPLRGSVAALSVSFPVIEPSKQPPPLNVAVGSATLKPETVVDVNLMARRALKDEMPGLVVRGISRAIAKGVLQNEAQKRGGILGGLVATVATVATEQADDRMWRSLPGTVSIARAYLPEGLHQIRIDGREIGAPVEIKGQYAVVPVRLLGAEVLVGDVATIGQLAAPAPAPAAAAPQAAPSRPAPSKSAKPSPKPAQ